MAEAESRSDGESTLSLFLLSALRLAKMAYRCLLDLGVNTNNG